MGWEVGHQTEGELVPTIAAGGGMEGRCICVGPWIKPPTSQGREENWDTTRKEKHELTPGTLQPCIRGNVAWKSFLPQ